MGEENTGSTPGESNAEDGTTGSFIRAMDMYLFGSPKIIHCTLQMGMLLNTGWSYLKTLGVG